MGWDKVRGGKQALRLTFEFDGEFVHAGSSWPKGLDPKWALHLLCELRSGGLAGIAGRSLVRSARDCGEGDAAEKVVEFLEGRAAGGKPAVDPLVAIKLLGNTGF